MSVKISCINCGAAVSPSAHHSMSPSCLNEIVANKHTLLYHVNRFLASYCNWFFL